MRSVDPLTIQSERDGDTHYLRVAGELDLDSAQRVDDELMRVEASDVGHIVVDLGELEFIDSVGLRILVRAGARSRQAKRLTLLRARDSVHRVFEISGLDSRLPFVDGDRQPEFAEHRRPEQRGGKVKFDLR